MSNTPDPALVAAAPFIDAALVQLETFVVTTLTGDPLLIPQRAKGAFDILKGNLELQIPGLFAAEAGAVQTDITGGIDGLRAKLKAAITPAA